jgi:hypothetical protein
MMRRLLLTAPAAIGGAGMAWSLYASSLFSFSADTFSVWATVSLGPYLFVAVVAWRSRTGVLPGVLAVTLALLLTPPPLACISDRFGEGCQYLLVLSPFYLWAVVAVAAILEPWTRRPPASESL